MGGACCGGFGAVPNQAAEHQPPPAAPTPTDGAAPKPPQNSTSKLRAAIRLVATVQQITLVRCFLPDVMPGVTTEAEQQQQRQALEELKASDLQCQREWDEQREAAVAEQERAHAEDQLRVQQAAERAGQSVQVTVGTPRDRECPPQPARRGLKKGSAARQMKRDAEEAAIKQAAEEAALQAEADAQMAAAMQAEEEAALKMAEERAERKEADQQMAAAMQAEIQAEAAAAAAEAAEQAAAAEANREKRQQQIAAKAADKAAADKAAADKTEAMTQEQALRLPPILNHYGNDEAAPQIYGLFMESNGALHTPTAGPLVTDIPFAFCLITDPTVKEIQVLANSDFPAVATIQARKLGKKHIFWEPALVVTGDAETLVFYAATEDGGKTSLQGLFNFDAISKHQKFAEGVNYEEAIATADNAIAAGSYAAALEQLYVAQTLKVTVEVLSKIAQVLLRQEQYSLATAAAIKALALDQSNQDAWKVRVESELIRGEYAQCIESCKLAVENGLPEFTQVLAEAREKLAVLTYAEERWTVPDEHATSCPETADVVGTAQSLARYLTEPFSTDAEKHRVIFRWITDHISYNGAGYKTGDYGDLSPAGVLKSRTGVCSGYSRLYQVMADECGLECESVSGYCKGFSYKPGAPLKVSHAWNVIRFDNVWRPVDSTWSAGSLGNDYKFSKCFAPFWWDATPDQFIYSHYPEIDSYKGSIHPTCVDDPVDLQTWATLPNLKGDFFDSGLELTSHNTPVIEARGGSEVEIVMTQKKSADRVHFIIHMNGKKGLKAEYDEVNKKHTIAVTAPKKGEHELTIFFNSSPSGQFAHLLDYKINVI